MRETKYVTVVIADGHQLIRTVIKAIVLDAGFKVIAEVSNGSELIDNLKKSGVPDIIICNTKLPDSNNLEVCFAVKQRYPSCKMLAVSFFAYPYNEDLVHSSAIDICINDFSHPKQLTDALHKLADQ